MSTYVGLDVSQKLTSVCVIDDAGQRLWQGSVATDAAALTATIRARAPEPCKVGMETGPLAV